MTTIWGNDNGGGGSGPNGHRVIVSYSVVGQSIAGNYTDLYWQYGVDYGDPNWWNNITNRSISWSVTTGASVAGVGGFGTGTSDPSFINTSDPGYGGQIHYFWDGTVRLTHNSNGQGTIHLAASMNFNSNTYTSAINTDIGFANIIRPPSAPTLLSASRISDTQINLAWTNNSGTFTAYDGVKVFRSTDGGGYALVATLGVVASYNDTGVLANHKYTYYVEAFNGAGVADSAATSAVWTTPGAPTSLTATKTAGNDVQLTWINNVNYSEYTVRIEESQNGGAYAEITSVAAGTTSYTHVAPSTLVTHKYRVRARTTTGTTLNSAYSNESATVTLLSTANAPSNLAPSGSTFDATEAIVFTWTHNPTDGTAQSSYRIQYEVNGGSTVTIGPTSSSVSSYTLPASTVANGATITWRVATAGQNGTLSANSATSTFFTKNRPTSTISSPAGATINTSSVTVNWTYFQAQGSAQTAWHAYLYKKGALSDFSDATVIGEMAGTGTTASTTFPNALQNGVSYGVRVYVTSAVGLVSVNAGTQLKEFNVVFLPPAAATLTALYEANYGRTVLTVTGATAVGGSTEAIATVSLQRQINGGDWVTWATGIVLAVGSLVAVVVDTAPTVKGTNKYRAITYSALPSSATNAEITVTTAETRWGFLSAGPGFTQLVRMRALLAKRATLGRNKSQYNFAGREKPVELSGEETSLVLAISATLFPPSQGGMSSEPEEMESLALTTGPVLWRDHTGRRIFASLSDVDVDYEVVANKYPVSFSVKQVDYDENVG